jgi:predicted DNA repair protein MutK
MPATGLLALLDDITSILDDVALMTRVAAKKTAGVIGDDLALNAEQVTGAHPDRELPVVWAVAKGAMLNKAILVPAALAISAFAPWLVQPLLMIGGLVLCYEGFEKVWAKVMPHAPPHAVTAPSTPSAAAHTPPPTSDSRSAASGADSERAKIRGAIRTDFILSAEIVVIALGTMASEPLVEQVVALTLVGVGITVFVYGLVAGIVKLDDVGLRLLKGPRELRGRRRFGVWLLRGMPWLMRGLSVAGTAAMFLVGGSILLHGVPAAHHVVEHWAEQSGGFSGVVSVLADGVTGLVAGGVAAALAWVLARLRGAPAT